MILTYLTRQLFPGVVLVMFILILSESAIKAQNTVGIGTSTPNQNAVLDLVSPTGNQGVLVPRITTSQRQGMATSLGPGENGLIVFDSELNQFFHWVDDLWVVGLGSFSDIAGGDLQGTYPNPTLKPDVVNSSTIVDGTVSNSDLADGSVTAIKIDSEGNGNTILGTDAAGNPRWEPKTNFLGNGLPDGTIMIGDASNLAQSRTLTGDISLSNDGTVTIADDAITTAKMQDNAVTAAKIATDAVGTEEIVSGSVGSDEVQDASIQRIDLADNVIDGSKIEDNSITAADIATDGVTSDEISSGAVASEEIADGSIQSVDIANGAINSANIADGTIATDDIASGGNNKVLITTGAGTVFWENITLFETSTLAEGSIFVGDVSNTAAALNAKGAGRILIGDGTSIQSLNINGDISLSASGDAQINTGVVGSSEINDNSVTRDDIAPNAIESSELADNAVDNGAIQDDAVSASKIQDNSIITQKIAANAVNSSLIADGTISTVDLADDAVNVAKIDSEGNTNSVMTTSGSGDPQWESRSNFGTSSLPNANLFIGDASGISQAQPVSGDVTLNNNGNIQINNDVIGTSEIIDNAITLDDIGPNAVSSSELADNAVDAGAIQSDAVVNSKIASGAVDITKIDGGGNLNAILTTDIAGSPQWEPKAGLDIDPTNEIQDLSLLVNTLVLSGDPTTVDLSGYLDNTDNQDLALAGNTLSLTNDATSVDLSGYLDNTDSQDLNNVLTQGNSAAGAAITNLANPTNPQDAATKNYVDALEAADADGDPTNEIQDLTLTGNTLGISSDPTTVDLSGYLDNTDNQDLTLAGNTLSLTNDATTVDLSGYLDNTDVQDLTLAGNILSLTNDATTVDLSGYLDNTDVQDLSLAGNILSLTNDATSVDLSGYLDNTDSQDLSDVLSQGNDAGGTAITNVANPGNAQDVATKNYVDNISIGTGNLANDAVTTGKISNGTIINADIAAAAAIDGSKINPDFGTQNIQTTGTLNTGAATVSSLTVSNLGGSSDTYTGDGAVNSFTISAGGVFSSSDARLKENVQSIPGALDRILQVEGKKYNFINDQKAELHYGVIAQDLMQLFPELVKENENGFLAVNYMELVPVLVEAIKQQQQTINKLLLTLEKGDEINGQLRAGLLKQQKLIDAQQMILQQLQTEKSSMQRDIDQIKYTLGLEAKN